MYLIVESLCVPGQGVRPGEYEAVGQFAVMQNGSTAAESPYHVGFEARRVAGAVGIALKVSQRKRGTLPLVESQHGNFRFRCRG